MFVTSLDKIVNSIACKLSSIAPVVVVVVVVVNAIAEFSVLCLSICIRQAIHSFTGRISCTVRPIIFRCGRFILGCCLVVCHKRCSVDVVVIVVVSFRGNW